MKDYTNKFKVTENRLIKMYCTDGTYETYFFYQGDRERLVNAGWTEIN